MNSRISMTLLLLGGVVLTACDGGEAVLSTTSSLVTGTTESVETDPTTTLGRDGTAPSDTLVGETVASSEIVARISTDNGEILYIVIPPGAYTDVDLENFIGDLREGQPDLWGAEVFDEENAVQAFVIPEAQRTEEQQGILDQHHLVSLVGGDTIKYQGPFSELGESLIGS